MPVTATITQRRVIEHLREQRKDTPHPAPVAMTGRAIPHCFACYALRLAHDLSINATVGHFDKRQLLKHPHYTHCPDFTSGQMCLDTKFGRKAAQFYSVSEACFCSLNL